MPSAIAIRRFSAACFLLLLVIMLADAAAQADVYDRGIVLTSSTDEAALREFLDNVHEKSLNSGIINFTPYSLLLINQSQAALHRADFKTAGIFTEYARRLAPGIVPVYTARAVQLFQESKTQGGSVARNLILAFLYSFSPANIENLSQIIFENSAALALSILLSFCCITLLIVAACLPRLYHDLRHVLSDWIPDFSVMSALLLLFSIPLLFRLSVVWVCAWALVVLFAYLSKSARQVVTGYFIILAILLPLLAWAMGFSRFMAHDTASQLLIKSNYGYCDARETALLENLNEEELRKEIFFSLGLVYKRAASFEMAHKYYEKVLNANPRYYQAAINRGNVYFAQSNWDAAIQQYELAAAINSRKAAAAYFNLSRVYQQKFMFSESEEALNTAKRLDLSRVSQYLKDFTDNYNRLVIDETIPVGRLWDSGYKRFSPASPIVQEIWTSMAGGLSYRYGPVAFLGLLVLMLYLVGNDRFRISVRCKLCGKPICRRCQQSTVHDMVCVYCNSLLRKQGALGYGIKEEKSAGIKRHLVLKKWIARASGLALPGAGHLWAGQPVKGAAIMLIFFLLLFKTLIPLVLDGPWDFLFGPRTFEFGLYASLFLAYWAGMALYARRLPVRTMEESLILRIIS